MDGAGYSSDSDPSRRNSASKRAPACAQCRRRKIGCDRLKPSCTSCIKFHKERCIYPDDDPEAFNQYIMQPTTHPYQTRRPSNLDIYTATTIAAGINGMPTGDNDPFRPNSSSSTQSNASTATARNSAAFNVQPQQPASSGKTLHQGKMMQVIQPTGTGRAGSFSIAPNATIPLQSGQSGPYISAAQSMQQMHQQNKFRNAVKVDSSNIIMNQQSVKIHKAQNAPVYEPPTIVTPSVTDSTKTKHVGPKRSHHAKHNTGMPKVNVSLEEIGSFNTMEHMLHLVKDTERKNNTFPPRSEMPVEFGVMQSTSKQQDIFLKEMRHLRTRLIELQRQNKGSSQNKIHKKPLKSTEASMVDLQKLNSDSSRTTSQTQQTGSSQTVDVLSIINLHTRVSNFGKSELLIKDTPNSLFTINFLVNRDNFLTSYYSNLQTFIIMNYKDQLTQFKQKQFNEVNKRMGNAPEEKDLLHRLVEKLTKSLDKENVIKPVLFMQYLGCVLDNIEELDVRKLGDVLFGQFDKTYGTPANYLVEVAKLGTLLIVLLFCMVINNVGSAPEIEVLKRKINYILDEVKSVSNRDLLTQDNSILKLLTVRSFFHDMVEDFDQLNDVDVDEEVYLVKWSTNHDNDVLRYAVFRNYMNRHINKGALPSMLTFEEIRESVEGRPFATEAVKEIELWQAEVDILNHIESRGNTTHSVTSISKLRESLTRLREVYDGVFKDDIGSSMNAVSKRVTFQTYHKICLMLHYYIALQYEVAREGKKFAAEVSEVLRHAAAIAELPHGTHESKCLFAKTDLVVLELVSEILFSLGLRCKSASAPETTAPVSNDMKVALSVLKGKLTKTLCKISYTLTRTSSPASLDRYNYIHGSAQRLVLKLHNFISWLQLRKAVELPHLPNAAVHMDMTETASISGPLHHLSEALVREEEDDDADEQQQGMMMGGVSSDNTTQETAQQQWHAEYKRSLETLRTRATAAGNMYGLTASSFSALFEATFQK